MADKVRLTAGDIIRVLAAKHSEDVFVPECKTGASRDGYMRLDAWVMAKSWAHPLVTGYEIKVSRQDFLNDHKWTEYLQYCNEFYFVCPKGLIQPEELPKDVGLLWVSDTCTRAYTKRKAVHREVQIPEELFRYILMARVQITREVVQGKHDKQYWASWLQQKKLDYEFGWHVSKSIRETVDAKIHAVEKRNKELESLIDRYRDIKGLIKSLGFDTHDLKSWSFHDRLTAKLQEIKIGVGKDLVDYLKEVTHNISNAVEVLNRPMIKENSDELVDKSVEYDSKLV